MGWGGGLSVCVSGEGNTADKTDWILRKIASPNNQVHPKSVKVSKKKKDFLGGINLASAFLQLFLSKFLVVIGYMSICMHFISDVSKLYPTSPQAGMHYSSQSLHVKSQKEPNTSSENCFKPCEFHRE